MSEAELNATISISTKDYLDMQFGDIRRRLGEQDIALASVRNDVASVKLDVAAVKSDTSKTNGRVTKLEQWRDSIKEFLDIAIEVGKDRKKKIGDIGWTVVKLLVVGFVVYVLTKIGAAEVFHLK